MDDLSQLVNDPGAAPVLSLMREGRWRKARDAAKDLCKRDRGRYLPLLIEANVGLARELIGKGLVKDASTVVAYLETIAPVTVVTELKAALTAPVNKQAVPSPSPADKVLCWAAVLRVDLALTTGGTPSAADLAEVDLLVADGYWPDPPMVDEQVGRVLKELGAVRAACDATGDGQWEAAQEALRGVPGQSVFRHWRLFLRGVRCFFQEQPDTVRQCFGGLPPGGALARAARALAPGLVPSGPVAPATARVPLYLAMTAQPAAWAPALLAANAAWKVGKRVKAYEELSAGMKGAFPAAEPGLPALLTEAVLPFRAMMSYEDSTVGEQLTARNDIWDDRKVRSFPESVLAFIRPMTLAGARAMSPKELEACWGRVIELWHRCQGAHPLRDSLAWQWLGETLAKPRQGDGLFAPPQSDFKRARTALDKAVKCDPDNEAAWVALIEVYNREGDHKARNKLLDDLTKRFPNNKNVLVQTGSLAVDRKAFDKGLKALRAALALDPLDKHVKSQIAIALVLQIRDYHHKHRDTAPLWQQLEPILEDRAGRDHWMLSRWMARVRRAVLDPDPQAARIAFDDAIRLAPSAVERLFMEQLLASLYRAKTRPAWQQDWNAAALAGGLTWAILLQIFQYHAFAASIAEWSNKENLKAVAMESLLCDHLIKDELKLDIGGVVGFTEQISSLVDKADSSVRRGLSVVLNRFIEAVDQATSPKKKSPDPRLRLCALLLDEHQGGPRSLVSEKFFKEVESLSAAAEALGLAEVIELAAALRQRWELRAEQAKHRPPDYDLDDEDDEDDDFDDIFDEDDDDADPLVEELGVLMQRLEWAVLSGNLKLVAAIRKELHEFGVPNMVIDAAIAEIKTRQPKPSEAPPPPRYQPPKPPKPPVVDPNQLDLL